MNFIGTLEDQQRVGEGVVADGVAGFGDVASNVGALLHVASDQEKSGMNLVLGQDLQQTQSVRVVGAVVVGECDLPGSARHPGESSTTPLAAGSHRLISTGYSSGGGDGAGYHVAQHAGIVN